MFTIVNGQATPDFNTVSHTIRDSRGRPITVMVMRNGKLLTLGPVRTKKIGDRWALGFEPGWVELEYGPWGSLSHSLTAPSTAHPNGRASSASPSGSLLPSSQ